jgi:hypothetical protein
MDKPYCEVTITTWDGELRSTTSQLSLYDNVTPMIKKTAIRISSVIEAHEPDCYEDVGALCLFFMMHKSGYQDSPAESDLVEAIVRYFERLHRFDDVTTAYRAEQTSH